MQDTSALQLCSQRTAGRHSFGQKQASAAAAVTVAVATASGVRVTAFAAATVTTTSAAAARLCASPGYPLPAACLLPPPLLAARHDATAFAG